MDSMKLTQRYECDTYEPLENEQVQASAREFEDSKLADNAPFKTDDEKTSQKLLGPAIEFFDDKSDILESDLDNSQDRSDLLSALTGSPSNSQTSTVDLVELTNNSIILPRLNSPTRGESDIKKEIEESNEELDKTEQCSTTPIFLPDRFDSVTIPHTKDSLRTRSEITDISDLGNRLYTTKVQDQPHLPASPIDEEHNDGDLAPRVLEILEDVYGQTELRGFYPRDRLLRFITVPCVSDELKRHFPDLDAKSLGLLAMKVCGEVPEVASNKQKQFKWIFAILVLIEKVPEIRKFLEENVSDDDLPLRKIPCPGKSKQLFELGRRREPNTRLKCLSKWTCVSIRSFESTQWLMLAPFFGRSQSRKVYNIVLADQAVLPFIYDSREDGDAKETPQHEGGFSLVFKAKIHPEHHDYHESKNCDQSFAIKCLSSRDKNDFNKEVDTLRRFSENSGQSHPHLISLLATYEQNRKFYLVFHWAEADLERYWTAHNPQPDFSLKMVMWVGRQCQGIADGLLRIHEHDTSEIVPSDKSRSSNPSPESPTQGDPHPPSLRRMKSQLQGRHGDIKPANILWFCNENLQDDQGTLKISDFGLTEFSPLSNKSNTPQSQVCAASRTYRAPELDLKDGMIGPSYDIWSLGCVYLEFITWLLGGKKLLNEFGRRRYSADAMLPHEILGDAFFEVVKLPESDKIAVMVKPAVDQFMIELHEHSRCSEFLHDFINLIRFNMIVVKSDNRQERARLRCNEINHQLLKLIQRCKQDPKYAVYPAPWAKRHSEHGLVGEAVEVSVHPSVKKRLIKTNLRVHHGRLRQQRSPSLSQRVPELRPFHSMN